MHTGIQLRILYQVLISGVPTLTQSRIRYSGDLRKLYELEMIPFSAPLGA